MNFSPEDLSLISRKGISIQRIENQINIFTQGITNVILESQATLNDGIIRFSELELENLANQFDSDKNRFKLTKFVPASGAASRMFQFLNEFLNELDLDNQTINSYLNGKKATNLKVFLTGIEKFPFYNKIERDLLEIYPDYKKSDKNLKRYYFIKTMLSEDYFDFANKPKGVLDFHQYENNTCTPIEEHLKESLLYSNSNNLAEVHFTVSEAHQEQFETIIKKSKSKLEASGDSKIEVAYSYQKSETDTLAVDFDNQPLRDSEGTLVFRPGGHGALIENLNAINSDIIFIKNIDNVIHNRTDKIAFYKKALAGLLLELQNQIFIYLNNINAYNEVELDLILMFIKTNLNYKVTDEFYKKDKQTKREAIVAILNRPIRVCGMVQNEGEPGGGPFWIKDNKGNLTLQIVETSQINLKNKQQEKILKNSTHFNPVDLVCGVKNYKGEKFDLTQFIDHNTGFIVEKNKNGIKYKSYELPGLWNGAMANWITIFVEVPLITFNPVKTVNDLLKPTHQPD
jgi:hypothetical protein